MIRSAAVAGLFYPSDPQELKRQVEECLAAGKSIRSQPPLPDPTALAIVVPHAGYVYSGSCAGAVYSSVTIPECVVILCPNHWGLGAPLAIMPEGAWKTPLGEAPVDEDLARALMSEDDEIEVDDAAHSREHALEVQLPFLQVVRPGLRFVPLSVGTHDPGSLAALGEALARVIRKAGEPVLVVVSSDMSHYIPADRARELDRKAIAAMESVDPEGLQQVVQREKITMCGIAPAVAGLTAARALGGARGRLLAYTNSGDRTGNYGEVVAYAGLSIS